MPATPRMTFRKFGRAHHLRITAAEDLQHVFTLDEAHWVAMGAPLQSLNLDLTFLRFVDTDNNGRIMSFEIANAVHWLFDNLKDHSGITAGALTLKLNSVNTETEDGSRIHQSATKILRQLGAPKSDEIALHQVRKIKDNVEKKPVSEAGIAVPEASKNPNVRQFLSDIIATVGGKPHPSGNNGVDQDLVDEFRNQAKAYLDWHSQGTSSEADSETNPIMPLGANTTSLFELYTSLRDKIDQYFAQCRAVEFDERATQYVIPTDDQLKTADLDSLAGISDLLKEGPLAAPKPHGSLALDDKINPFYSERISRLRTEVLIPVFGAPVNTLSEDQWKSVRQLFSPHEEWIRTKAGAAVEKLGTEKLKAYLDGRYTQDALDIISESNRTAFVLDNIRNLEKIVLFQANMITLVNNFVSFPHLYDPKSTAAFEMGTLIMDGRRFNFSIKVENRAQHAAVAKTSNIFVVYAEVLPASAEKFEIAVPITSGGKGNLCVGKRGLFHDVLGRKSDAIVLQIIENPISMQEAIVSPFQRLGKLLSGKIEAMTSAAEKKLDAAAATVETTLTPAAQTPQPSKGLMAGGMLMGGGVAVAALGSAFAYIARTLAGVGLLKILIGLGVAVLAVILPVSIMALIRLRSRDLSAVLEGAGWAINSRMRLTFRQSRIFTMRPDFPEGAKGVYPWGTAIFLLLAIAVEAILIALYIKGL
jgi:hypothetical protein